MYYNIHTHHLPDDKEITAIYNLSVTAEEISLPSCKKESGRGENLFFSAGIHPWYIDSGKTDRQLASFHELINRPCVVAVGEAGLDKLATVPLALQEKLFIAQATVAEETNKPLLIHCVKAWSEIICLRKKLSPRMPWIIHGFRGNPVLAGQLLSHGFYLSVSDRLNEDVLQEEILPRLFLETDDRQVDIRQVYRKVAFSLKMEPERLEESIRENVHRVFSI